MGCRSKRLQRELVRVARRADGDLVVDRLAPGRGAWLCVDSVIACLEQAVKKKAIARTLKAPIRDGSLDSLRAFLSIHERMEGRGM